MFSCVQQRKRSGIFSNVLLLVLDGWAVAIGWVDVYMDSHCRWDDASWYH
jgi:hypothetical protein